MFETTDFSHSSIDAEGYRANVGIMLVNNVNQLFWAKRTGMDAWQFPQGGIRPKESTDFAMYRELREEIGLLPEHVEIIARTSDWLKYRLPERYIRKTSTPLCIGQKQRWYLLRFIGDENHVQLNISDNPEFDHWRWIDFWEPINQVIKFKRSVYQQALEEFAYFIEQ